MKYYFQFIICKNWDSRILKKIRNPQNISILFSSPSFSVAIIANVVAGKKLAKMEDLGIERRSVERQTTIEYLVRQWWRGFSPSRIGTIWRGARRYPQGRQAWATAKGLGGNSRDGAHKSAARDPRGARRRRLEEGWQAGPSIKC